MKTLKDYVKCAKQLVYNLLVAFLLTSIPIIVSGFVINKLNATIGIILAIAYLAFAEYRRVIKKEC
ncbi:hypothetical protein KY334_01405 [Candidatus Woesearchaeota archaeon]|nr:hypothetical protein [Candidatus Woesearchaeota archaeon]